MTQKNMYISIAIAAVVVILGGIYISMNLPPNVNKGNTASSQTAAQTTTSTTSSTSSTSTTPAATLSYNEALNLYKGKIIQLGIDEDGHCVTTPNSLSFMRGTTVMFDNRSSITMHFTLDGKQHTIAPYGFEITALTTAATEVPHDMSIDCEGGQNNGTIILQ